MSIRSRIEKLAAEKSTPCVTISLNTHRTHPDSAQDAIQLKNLLREAETRIINEFDKSTVKPLLDRLATIESEINVNYNLDSLHIFLSNETKEIIKSDWAVQNDGVHIGSTFNIRYLIKSYNRTEEYYILLLSQSGVSLYNTVNNTIIDEVMNEDFPFAENMHYNANTKRNSDSKYLDDLVREFLNKVDKAVVKMNNLTGLDCVVVCTEDNYSRLLQVADKPSIYLGYSSIDYNNIAIHTISKQGWELLSVLQSSRRTKAISDVKEAVANGSVITDLQEIYQAAIDGRGDLLIVHQDFSQPVLMTSDRTFDLAEERIHADVIDDITSTIAWEVFSKKGRVIFTSQEEIKDLGNIVLKTRY